MNPRRPSRLSHRDHDVINTINVLSQVTTSQLLRLHFSEPTTSELSRGHRTRRTLARLTQAGHIRRLGRPIGYSQGGSEGYTYLPARSRTHVGDPHAVDIAELYVRLVEAERQGRLRLLRFTPEDRVLHGTVEADAFIRVEVNGQEYEWYLEIDRGTEFKPQLRNKMRAYTKAASNSAYYPRVLYVVTFAAWDQFDKRINLISEIIAGARFPEQFQVCRLDDAINHLACG